MSIQINRLMNDSCRKELKHTRDSEKERDNNA